MNFEWEETKAVANLRKHQMSFEEAATVFEDDLSLTGRDPDHSVGEHRFITFGMSAENRILAVSHTERSKRFVSSVQEPRRGRKGKCMKKAKAESDELRPGYQREDFGEMVRGKYAARCREASNVVVISPDVQKAFPNAQAVNAALRGLLELAQATGLSARSTRVPRKRAVG